MPTTLYDLIENSSLKEYKKYFHALCDDQAVATRLAALNKEELEKCIKFLQNDFNRILLKLKDTPSQAEMQALVRGVLCAQDCSYLSFIFPPDYIHPLKKEWTYAILLSLLSKSANNLSDLYHIFHWLWHYSETRPLFNPEIVDFLLGFNENELNYLKKCTPQFGFVWQREPFKELMKNFLAGKPLSDWYEGELALAAENKDPHVIRQLLSSESYSRYLTYPHKKPAAKLIEFVIKHNFLEFVDELINVKSENPESKAKNLALALRVAIEQENAVLVKSLCDQGALNSAENVLYEAFKKHNILIFKILIEAGADVNKDNILPEITASILGATYALPNTFDARWSMLELLLQTEKCKKIGDEFSYAISYNHVRCVQLFIKHGALKETARGTSYLTTALNHDALEVIPFLMAAGEPLNEASVNQYKIKISASQSENNQQIKDRENELPLIRESLLDGLKELVQAKNPAVNLRQRVKDIFNAKRSAQINLAQPYFSSYSFLTNYQTKSTWGNPPTFWKAEEGLVKRDKAIDFLSEQMVRVVYGDDKDMQTIAGKLGSYKNGFSRFLTIEGLRSSIALEKIKLIQQVSADNKVLDNFLTYLKDYFEIYFDAQTIHEWVSLDDETFKYLAACQYALAEAFKPLKPVSAAQAKQLIVAFLANKDLCDWYEGELLKAQKDPSVISILLTSVHYQKYLAALYKKPAPTILEFVIDQEYLTFFEPLVGSDPVKLNHALLVAIKEEKQNAVKKLIEMDAVKTAPSCLEKAMYKSTEIFEILLKANADVNAGVVPKLVTDILSQSGFFIHEIQNKQWKHLELSLKTGRCTQLGNILTTLTIDNQFKLAELFIHHGALKQITPDQVPLLVLALQHDALEVIPFLIADGQTLDEQTLSRSVMEYEISDIHFLCREPMKNQDHQAELPLIRESLREALIHLFQTQDPRVQLRLLVKDIFNAKKINHAQKTKTWHTSYTFLTNYQNRKTWGQPPVELTQWKMGDQTEQRDQVVAHLMGQPVKIITCDHYNKNKIEEFYGQLRWYGEPSHKLVGMPDSPYGIYISNIQSIELLNPVNKKGLTCAL